MQEGGLWNERASGKTQTLKCLEQKEARPAPDTRVRRTRVKPVSWTNYVLTALQNGACEGGYGLMGPYHSLLGTRAIFSGVDPRFQQSVISM